MIGINLTDARGRRNPGAFLARSRLHPLGAILRVGRNLSIEGSAIRLDILAGFAFLGLSIGEAR